MHHSTFGLVLTVLVATSVVKGIDQKCMDCICKVESGCRPLGCGDDKGSNSCGFFQLKKPYYIDCHEPGKKPGESTEKALERCGKDKACSEKCVRTYTDRYASHCHENPNCEVWSRIHNGGPNGCHVGATVPYWNKVKACLVKI